MIQTILNKIVAVITSLVISVTGFFGGVEPPEPLGATIPTIIALFETSLSSKITSSATSMTLVKGTDKAGNAISGYICFVIDEGNASEEFVCGTAAGTAVTSMIRGIDPVDGKTEDTDLQKSHRRGASVKISNYPQLAIISRILNGDETFPNAISYASQPTFTGDEEIITKKYADDLAIAGSPDATIAIRGIIELATVAEISASTATGSTGASLVVANTNVATTSQSAVTVVATQSDGKLDQSFLDLTEDYTFSGTTALGTSTVVNLTASGTTTLATTTVNGNDIDSLFTSTLDQYSATSSLLFDSGTGASSATPVATTTVDGAQRLFIDFEGAFFGGGVDTGATTIDITVSIDGVDVTSSKGSTYSPGNDSNSVGAGSVNFISDVLSAGDHGVIVTVQNVNTGDTDDFFLYYSLSIFTIK